MTDVTIAELPERLAEVLEEVRQGGSVRILDGNQPIARFEPMPYAESVRRAAQLRPLGEVELPPLTFKPDFDGVEELLKDRRRR